MSRRSMVFHETYAFVSDSQIDISAYGKEYQLERRSGVINAFASRFCEFVLRRWTSDTQRQGARRLSHTQRIEAWWSKYNHSLLLWLILSKTVGAGEFFTYPLSMRLNVHSFWKPSSSRHIHLFHTMRLHVCITYSVCYVWYRIMYCLLGYWICFRLASRWLPVDNLMHKDLRVSLCRYVVAG